MPEIDKINSDLKLVFPIRFTEDGEPTVWAYHTSISRDVFEANYRIIASAHAELFTPIFSAGDNVSRGMEAESARHIASLALKDAASVLAAKRGLEDKNPAGALLAEIKRLTTVLCPGPSGYEILPVEIAEQKGVIDADDWREAEASIAFFTCGRWMLSRARQDLLRAVLALVMQGSTTSLAPLEFASSLSRSTKDEPSKEPASSIPS